jgi:hypothetical protein
MNITTLYAELVVVGTGALVFLLLFFYSIFGNHPWFSQLPAPSSIGSAIYLIPVLSVVYLLGIVISNISYLWFHSFEERLRRESLKELGEPYQYDRLRNSLFTSPTAKDLVGEFEFRRSKVRICRGWFINCFFIILAIIACFLKGRIDGLIALFGIITIGALMVGTRISWRTATDNELEWVRSYAEQQVQAQNAGKTTLVPDAKQGSELS